VLHFNILHLFPPNKWQESNGRESLPKLFLHRSLNSALPAVGWLFRPVQHLVWPWERLPLTGATPFSPPDTGIFPQTQRLLGSIQRRENRGEISPVSLLFIGHRVPAFQERTSEFGRSRASFVIDVLKRSHCKISHRTAAEITGLCFTLLCPKRQIFSE